MSDETPKPHGLFALAPGVRKMKIGWMAFLCILGSIVLLSAMGRYIGKGLPLLDGPNVVELFKYPVYILWATLGFNGVEWIAKGFGGRQNGDKKM
jgi:hypothetical protein